jgi:outer membrane protein assembly factor BamB
MTMAEPEVRSLLRQAVADVHATADLWAAIVDRHRHQRRRQVRALAANLALLLFAAVALGGLVSAQRDALRERADLDRPPSPTVAPRQARPVWTVSDAVPTLDASFELGPTAAGELVLIPSESSEPGRVRAYDARTGKPRWVHETDTGFAAIGRKQVVLARQYGLLVALDLATGGERWRLSLAPAQSPERGTIAGDSVYVGTSFPSEGDVSAPIVYALDLATGRQRWRAVLDPGTDLQWGAPVVTGGLVLVADTPSDPGSAPASHLHALDASTGRVRWTADLHTGEQGFHFQRPLVAGGLVHAASGSGGLVTFEADSGKEVWRFGSTHLPSIVGVSGAQVLAVMHGYLVALDRRSGAERWAASVGVGGFGGGAVLVGDTVYTAGSGGVIAIDAATGTVRWRSRTDHRPIGPPVSIGTSVYVATERRLTAFDARTGTARWTSDELALGFGPVATPGGVVVATTDGEVLAFAP